MPNLIGIITPTGANVPSFRSAKNVSLKADEIRRFVGFAGRSVMPSDKSRDTLVDDMSERERQGDVTGPSHGDFTDWDNPEDRDDEPDDYYEDEEEDDGSYIPGPDDPDYDLSEAASYAGWDPPTSDSSIPRWLLVGFSILFVLAMLLPLWIRIT